MNIPENYDGTTFMPSVQDPPQERNIRILGECSADAKLSPQSTHSAPCESEGQSDGEDGSRIASASILDGIPILKSLQGVRTLSVFKDIFPKKIGSEEILIAATALFLLFSKSGDKECAIMLIFLLFVAK